MNTQATTRHVVSGGMLLIHGAWQGSWTWNAWLPELALRGWHARAVDLPGNGASGSAVAHAPASMQTYLETLEHAVRDVRGPVVVVAHSGGGVLASQFAEHLPDRVACVVYVAGMMLPSGLGYAEFVHDYAHDVPGAAGIGPYLEWSDDLSVTRVPPAAALQIFVHDCTPALARAAASQLRPQQESGRALVASLTSERYGSVPRIYIEALRDRSVLLAIQRRMQARSPGALVKSIDCGHVPQLARPSELADIVCAALSEIGIGARERHPAEDSTSESGVCSTTLPASREPSRNASSGTA